MTKRLINKGTTAAFEIGEAEHTRRGGCAIGLRDAVAAHKKNSAVVLRICVTDELIERVAKAMRFDGSELTAAERDEIWDEKLKRGVKEYWRGFVRLTLREISAQRIEARQGGDGTAPCEAREPGGEATRP